MAQLIAVASIDSAIEKHRQMLQLQLVKNLGVGAALEGDAVWAASSLTDADPEIQNAAQRTTASESHSAAIAIRDEVSDFQFACGEALALARLTTSLPSDQDFRRPSQISVLRKSETSHVLTSCDRTTCNLANI